MSSERELEKVKLSLPSMLNPWLFCLLTTHSQIVIIQCESSYLTTWGRYNALTRKTMSKKCLYPSTWMGNSQAPNRGQRKKGFKESWERGRREGTPTFLARPPPRPPHSRETSRALWRLGSWTGGKNNRQWGGKKIMGIHHFLGMLRLVVNKKK